MNIEIAFIVSGRMSYRSRSVSRKRSRIKLLIDKSMADRLSLCVLIRYILSLSLIAPTDSASCSTWPGPARLTYRARTACIYIFDIPYSVICDTNMDHESRIWIMNPIRWCPYPSFGILGAVFDEIRACIEEEGRVWDRSTV
jgi:hypothetical protein